MSDIYSITKKYLHLYLAIIPLLILSSIKTADTASLRTNNELAVHFINVGQGDSTFISLPSGKKILIDTGKPPAGPEVVRYLKSLGVRKIDHLIFTHSHDDHIGGIFSIMSEFDVLNFYDNGFSNFESSIYRDYIKLVREDLSRYKILQAGETLHFGDIWVEVLNPLLPPTGNLNGDSIVLWLLYGEIKILLAGDIGQVGERRILRSHPQLLSHILKVAHHGENNTTSDYFLKRVKPEIAIISSGTLNGHAQPHPEVLKHLEQMGARIYRTDISGSIILRTDGKTYSITTEK